MSKLNVAVLGATGAVGQRFIELLEDHPWFSVAEVVASSRSAGRPYGEAANWILDGSPPDRIMNLTVRPLEGEIESPLVFSALPKEAAKSRELELAAAGHIVCTNASANRMLADVPLLIPEVNAEHVKLVEVQRTNRGWSTGALVANSNCTVMPLVMALAPLRPFGVRKVFMVSEQAISGAGYPGVASLDILDNIIPFVPDEAKVESESLKMLGALNGESIDYYDCTFSATCTRVPVLDGHLVNVAVGFENPPSLQAILDAWANFVGPQPVPTLPSAPARPVLYLPNEFRPQPRRDRATGKGMTTTIGRLRECPLLDVKFAALSHNTVRGAAGSSILNAELLAVEGYLKPFFAV